MGNTIVTSILSMAGLGLFFASILAVADQKLKVKEDPRVEEIARALPGVNCGVCGFTNCHQYAESLAKGEVLPNLCRAGGEHVITRLSEILGVKIEKKTKQVAIVHCGADRSKRNKKAIYVGVKTCLAAHSMSGGEIYCEYGCLGYGDCLRACSFEAITMINGLPKVNYDKCTACGKCVSACPRKIITIEKLDSENLIYVACSNKNKCGETRKACSLGCIACGLCQKLTNGIFHVEENLAHVTYEKIKNITDKKEVIKKCPTKCIVKV